ncbi:hypothetical protein HQ524_03795 [Candidatus Uhrbacteria bacterium]|nr:hypothetical protein [Candidatus Uhrbacteria bacterium]
MNIRFARLGTLLLSFALIGAGCNVVPQVPCDTITGHGSCVSDGVDEALIGSWSLVSQQVFTPAGSITNPASGRTLNIAADGSYTEDYSTETMPDGTALSIVSHCDILGLLSGAYEVESNLDLDFDPPVDVAELHVVPNGGSPQVKCQADGIPITSNASTSPLGVGPVEGVPPYVLYTYTMDDAWSQVVITQTNTIVNLKNIYTFKRIN